MLEQIVRPFQTPTAIPSNISPITKPVVVAPQKAVLSWGATGQAPTTVTETFLVNSGDGHKFKESKRYVSNVRVENPDDPNQYIVTQRIDSIEFQAIQPGASTSSSNTANTAFGTNYVGTTVSSASSDTSTSTTGSKLYSYTLTP